MKFGLSARFTGSIGDDDDGRVVLETLRSSGVDERFMIIKDSIKTARAYIWIDSFERGSRTVALDLTRFKFPDAGELDGRLPTSCRFFLVDGRAGDATIEGLKGARRSGVVTILDAGAVRRRFDEMLPMVDFAIVSRDLADTFCPGAQPLELASRLREAGAGVAVVTSGESGAYWMNSQGSGFVKGFEVSRVVDTTGAGDVFHGAFIYGLARLVAKDCIREELVNLAEGEMNRVVHFANVAAALSTRELSGVGGIPELWEVLGIYEGEKIA